MEFLDYHEMIESLEHIALQLESKSEWTLGKEIELIRSSLVHFKEYLFEFEDVI